MEYSFWLKVAKAIGIPTLFSSGIVVWNFVDKDKNEIKNFSIVYAFNMDKILDFTDSNKYECKVDNDKVWNVCEISAIKKDTSEKLTFSKNIAESFKTAKNVFQIKIHDFLKVKENSKIHINSKNYSGGISKTIPTLISIFALNYENTVFKNMTTKDTVYFMFKNEKAQQIPAGKIRWTNSRDNTQIVLTFLPLKTKTLNINQDVNFDLFSLPNKFKATKELKENSYYRIRTSPKQKIGGKYEFKLLDLSKDNKSKSANTQQHKDITIKVKTAIYSFRASKLFVLDDDHISNMVSTTGL